jgi:hypothetical protein
LDEEGALFDSGFDGEGPFRVTPDAGGVSLESALRDYGPAAIDDLIPRLRSIAHELDAAHAAGHVHGALHPSKVIVQDDTTSLIKGSVAVAPYAAPELAEGPATPASDQYGLAAIAYEWLFGRPIDHPAHRPVEVRSMPGVDRVALSKAFTRALAPKPAGRFASCTDFCRALTDATTPELPLVALDSLEDDDPVGPFMPESLDRANPNVDDIKIVAEESFLTAAHPDLDAMSPPVAEPVDTPVAAWNPSASSNASRSLEPQRFGAMALFLAVFVGAVFGFAAGYMARPRALQTGAPQEIATPGETDAEIATAGKTEARSPDASPSDAPAARASDAATPASKAPAPKAPAAPEAPSSVGRLLVRSTPSGASVSVNGVAKGATPLALRDLDSGTLNVVVSRPGYISETRRVVISNDRPARTLDVRLAAAAAPAQAIPRPSTPATIGRPAATTGSLIVDSRPSGATVTINGRASGSTPVTITDLTPGEYRVVMSLPGFHNFATTVRVVAGERVRAAASLTALEQE